MARESGSFGIASRTIGTCALLLGASQVQALDDGLARTPPMGWNSWNTFYGDISQDVILQTANAMVGSGMKEAGFRYIVLDDGWISGRDASGAPVENRTKFPKGFKFLTDSIHALGLKAGIYTAVGAKTCMGLEGSLDHEAADAKQYAAWGFDFLKNDWCKNVPSDLVSRPMVLYSRMKNAIQATGRPIVLSLCEKGQSGVATPWTWSDSVGHMWRTTNDINASFSTVIGRNVNGTAGLAAFQHPGGFNDPDMLEVGNTANGMTETEFESHFSLWCVMGSPLMAGNDLRKMTARVKSILTDKDAISVDQDSLGLQGARIVNDAGGAMVFVKKLKDPAARAILLFNNGAGPMNMGVKWTDKEIGWKSSDKVTVFNIWSKAKTTGVTDGFSASGVPRHGNAFLLLRNESMPTGIRRADSSGSEPSLERGRDGFRFSLPAGASGYTLFLHAPNGERQAFRPGADGKITLPEGALPAGIAFAVLSGPSGIARTWRLANLR